MIAPRNGHLASILPDGKVLVAGGSYLDSTEIFDPSTETWSGTGTMSTARIYSASAVSTNYGILVTGGRYGTYPTIPIETSSELYDPLTSSWTGVGSTTYARYLSATANLADGRTAVFGGGSGPPPQSAPTAIEIFDPATSAWSVGASLTTTRVAATATTLTDGRVLVVGGNNQAGTT